MLPSKGKYLSPQEKIFEELGGVGKKKKKINKEKDI